MDINQYLIESERTERKFPEGLTIDGKLATSAIGLLRSIETQALMLDVFKKVIIYDKPVEGTQERLEGLMNAGQALLNELEANQPESVTLDQDQIETFHALLGLVTEIAEIIPVLLRYVLSGEQDDKHIDTVNLGEEIADFCWYESVLLRKFDLDKGELLQKNIDKLRARYPEKFTTESALNRNLDAERSALHG